MSSIPDFEDAFKRAVTPGSERLLAGVALAAAGRSRKDGISNPPDFTATYGTLELAPASPPVSTDKTVVWLASCTKLVTTITALQCVERGLFTLDDPADVDRLLPEWKDLEILTGFAKDGSPTLQPAKEKKTLRQLLTHTSGITYDFFHPLLVQWRLHRGETPLPMRAPNTEGFLTPLVAEPGSVWMYGASLDLVGLMVARANDCTLNAYMRKNVFDVLGMNDTSFHPLEHSDLMERLMPLTSRVGPDELIAGDAPDAIMKVPIKPADEFGGAGLFSTAEDYLKVLKSILYNDGKLVQSSSIDLMFKPALSGTQRTTLEMVLSDPMGAAVAIPGEEKIGTPGAGHWTHGIGGLLGLHESKVGLEAGWMQWTGAPNCQWWIDRKGGTCGIFATQLFPPGDVKHAHLGNVFKKEMVAHFAKANS